MACILNDGKLTLSGDVGDFYFGECFTHTDVVIALAQIDDEADLTVFLNSGGGYTDEGAAIHALLDRRPGKTDIVVDGIAASAASLIAMAGDTVTMSAGSLMMIHGPSTVTIGNADEHNKTLEHLEALAQSWAKIYARKSGKSIDECRAIMKAERWYAPDEAVEEGFADAARDEAAPMVAAFDYRLYAEAPQRLRALASKKNWSMATSKHPAAPAAQDSPTEEQSMTDNNAGGDKTADLEKTKADAGKAAVTAYRERRKTVLAMDEAKGREGLAEHLVDTDLDEDAIRATLAAAPKAEAKADEPDPAADHERRRLNGEGLNVNGSDGKPKAKGDKSALAAAVARTNKRR
ncbi:hypothetical protein GCM10007989_05030 [Devosia pacifica]|uniref:ATP-dependent Clp protease proteolytic subunit n=1 Tax=Devosia pacifica TaxID=1335967 RepID=A0A918RW76_9HYPH|nr:head maturation protease, ClpP-related [Devosia pacifica]GHA13423.1 hypothetical protein GCM10007989_05030 [Devosia pacifica]